MTYWRYIVNQEDRSAKFHKALECNELGPLYNKPLPQSHQHRNTLLTALSRAGGTLNRASRKEGYNLLGKESSLKSRADRQRALSSFLGTAINGQGAGELSSGSNKIEVKETTKPKLSKFFIKDYASLLVS